MSAVEVVTEVFAAVREHDVERMVSLFAEDCVFEDVPAGSIASGVDEFRAYMEEVWVGIPDFHVEECKLVGDDGYVAGELLLAGRHEGEYLGIAPDKPKPIQWRAACFYTVDPVRRVVTHETYYYDLGNLRQTLGG